MNQTKDIRNLAEFLGAELHGGKPHTVVQQLTSDSRQVREGALFVCLRGAHADGHRFAAAAVAQGAVAVLAEEVLALPEHVTQCIVPDTFAAMRQLAAYFYDYPSRRLRLIGVTGTNGKTTVSHMIAHLLEREGYSVGVIGTVHVTFAGREEPVHNTTPDADVLQEIFARMVAAGVTHVVMEVSSHALAMGRVLGCEFDTAVFTNLTQDHLDYHETMENYAAAKAKLFALVSAPGTKAPKNAVLNSDDAYWRWPADAVVTEHCRLLTYGRGEADFRATAVQVRATGSTCTLLYDGAEYPIQLSAIGMFNVYNALAAIATGVAEGIPLPRVLDGMQDFVAVPGRFERVDEGQDFAVVVDYAHTPDGLENILKTAREITDGRVLITFGCGGDRDATKRPIMGEIAAKYADVVLITSDNPRSEDPDAIIAQVHEGAAYAQSRQGQVLCEPDRQRAIAEIIGMAATGDVVLIAGKGHEDYQILHDRTIHFDDREEARKVLRGN